MTQVKIRAWLSAIACVAAVSACTLPPPGESLDASVEGLRERYFTLLFTANMAGNLEPCG